MKTDTIRTAKSVRNLDVYNLAFDSVSKRGVGQIERHRIVPRPSELALKLVEGRRDRTSYVPRNMVTLSAGD